MSAVVLSPRCCCWLAQSFLSQGVHLVDLFVAGRFPIDRLVTFYDFAAINQAAADAFDGTTIKPVLAMPS
jgi:Zn-dependent alcohol dehydrogenase